jgi:hypothetical protein
VRNMMGIAGLSCHFDADILISRAWLVGGPLSESVRCHLDFAPRLAGAGVSTAWAPELTRAP